MRRATSNIPSKYNLTNLHHCTTAPHTFNMKNVMDKERVIANLMATGLWGRLDAEMGVEADFKCQYCGKGLLDTVDSYKEWQTDHLIPASAGGKDEKDNYVICCRTCNFIKGRWNPACEHSVSKPTRSQLIQSARKHIEQKRLDNERALDEFNRIIAQKQES